MENLPPPPLLNAIALYSILFSSPVPTTIVRVGLDLEPKVIINSSYIVDCPAIGIPPPNISWFKNGEPIPIVDTPHLRFLQDGHQLEILRARVADTALYECRAVNNAGTDSVNFDVQVHGKETRMAQHFGIIPLLKVK